MKRIFTALVLIFSLCACDAVSTMKDSFAQSEAVASDMEKAIGSKPFVGLNWKNGVLNSVDIKFDDIPKDRTTTEIVQIVRESIKNQFKQEPKQILVTFAITPR